MAGKCRPYRKVESNAKASSLRKLPNLSEMKQCELSTDGRWKGGRVLGVHGGESLMCDRGGALNTVKKG